ncbi:MAG: AMP-binding protein [Bacteroidetes bacterium]|nr:AMP-binding protein [Bacteroidota bacterium]
MLTVDFSTAQDIQTLITDRDHSLWEVPVFDFIEQWYADQPQFEVRTSGSTGPPKSIWHSRTSMTASAVRTCDFFGLKKEDTALVAMPAQYIGGKMMVLRSIVRGLRMICIEPASDPLRELDPMLPIDFTAFTPMQMSGILSHAASAEKLKHVRQIILGGGEVPEVLREQLQSLSAEVYESYGMTETITHIALKKLNGPDRSDYFTAMQDVTLHLDDRGCLVIHAPHLSEKELVTNDLAELHSPTEFRWLGRYDNVINTGGIKVYAEEIERKLQPFISVPFFITGTADNVLGQTVTLVAEGSHVLSQDELNEHLSRYEKIRRIIMKDKFAYTATGKINKKETLR